MSERSINENNKLWEAAERIAEKAVADKKAANEEERRKQKKRIIKIVLLMVLIALIIVFASIAWFAMNKAVSADTMAIEAAESPFELKTTGTEQGLYDEFLDEVTSDAYAAAATTEGHQGIKWQLTKDTSEMNNVYDGTGEPDMTTITRLDSDQYGLKPGDHGTLKFTIVSKTDADLSVALTLKNTGYKATFNSDNTKTRDLLTEVTNISVKKFISSHILFFYKGSDNKKHLLTSEGFTETVTSSDVNGEKEVTLYWVWTATLKEILNANIEGLNDTDASKEVRRYFFEHPEDFLKPIGTESFDDIKVTHNDDTAAEETAIANVISTKALLGREYTQYGSKYNDADQAIGDNANYLLVELTAALASNSND